MPVVPKILVVDDEPDLELLIRQKFRKKIQAQEIRFAFAQNGIEALEILQADNEIEVVLTDINMPKMDGLTFLGKLAERTYNPLLKAIIVSAYGDMENIRTAMNRGAFDFITKPIDFADLDITLEKTFQQIQQMKTALDAHNKLVALHKELSVANKIQQSIIPRNFPTSDFFELHADMIPAKEVGGDFYDFFMLDSERLGVIMADVSGKGVPAAIFMAMSRTLLHAHAQTGQSPSACIEQVNALLNRDSDSAMFVTVFYGILDIRSGEFTYCNGGHNPPLLLRASGLVVEIPLTGGVVVGILPDLTYSSHQLQIEAGDTLFLFTDGVTEAMNAQGELYSDERLYAKLSELNGLSVADIMHRIIEDVRSFTGDVDQSDDLTVMALRLKDGTV